MVFPRFAVIVVAVSSCAAQTRSRDIVSPVREAIIRTDANFVLVPVSVVDAYGTPALNLTRDDFVVKEEKKQQEILSFARENAPVSLGIVMDLSGSMAGRMVKARAAVKEFLANLEDEDEAFLITFSDQPELRVSFTSDVSSISESLLFAMPHGSTALYDAVGFAVSEMRWSARYRRKMLFLVSDGGDNHSRLTERELRNRIEEEDVQIHAIGLHERSDRMEEARGPRILEDLAKMTGGQHHMIENAAELPELAARMSRALHEQYVLGYRPNPPGLSGAFRRIEVRLRGPAPERLRVYARRGYRMP